MQAGFEAQLELDWSQAKDLVAAAGPDLQFVTKPFLAIQTALRIYTARCSMLLAFELGFEARLRRGATFDELMQGVHPQSRFPVGWMLPFLVDEGLLTEQDGCYRLEGNPDLSLDSVRSFAEREAPGNLIGFDLTDAVRQRILPFFTQGRNGESLLFDLRVFPLWLEYFRDESLTYYQNNLLTLFALREGLPAGARVLELGGGSGSFATLFTRDARERGVLDTLREYRFTDLAPAFLRRAQRELGARTPGLPLSFGALNLNRPLADQGLGADRFDAIVGVNVLHVAKDLVPTLRELRAQLAPGGRLVAGECLKPDPHRATFIEFFFQFMAGYTQVNLDPVLRPVHGFLTAAAWEANLRAAGFTNVVHHPDTRSVLRAFPCFYVGAFVASG
jgi:SAM-dependent methyltransferase